MNEARLVGYVRRSKRGGAIKVSINVDHFNNATRYKSRDGTEYVECIINLDRLRAILAGTQEVTSLVHLVDNENRTWGQVSEGIKKKMESIQKGYDKNKVKKQPVIRKKKGGKK